MIYTVELTIPDIEHIIKTSVEANSFRDAEILATEEYSWAKPTVKAIWINETANMEYDDRVVNVPLTNKLRGDLTSFLLMTTKYRDGERKAWESLSKELEQDGTPKFPNAKSNMKFWESMIEEIETIIHVLDNA